MVQRRKTSSRRTRKSDTTDKPERKDPVVVQQAPPAAVVKAIREIPEAEITISRPVQEQTEAEVIQESDALPLPADLGAETSEPVVEQPEAPAAAPAVLPGNDGPLTGQLAAIDFNSIPRVFFTNSFLSKYTGADLLFMLRGLKQTYTQLRAANSPGTEPRKASTLARMNELRAVLNHMGHRV